MNSDQDTDIVRISEGLTVRLLPRVCSAWTILDGNLLEPLIERCTQGMLRLEPHVSCELEDGHPGPHAGLVQSYTDEEQWARCNTARIETNPGCPSTQPDPASIDEQMSCLLPAGHPGRHHSGDIWWTD